MEATPSQIQLPDPPALLLATLTDDLLADILIRLPTLSDLGRASTVCVTFRCIISAHSFLRRLRALHPLPLLGIMSDTFIPAELPHPCATLARAIAPTTINFWCSFVPSRDRWRYSYFRDGRVLLAAVPEDNIALWPGDYDSRALIREFVVCDPLHRRYLMLPIIPEDLTALLNELDIAWFSTFLAPSEEGEGGTSFRVICLAQCQTSLVFFTFSSISGSWDAAEFDGWRALIAESTNPGFQPEIDRDRPDYAHGCLCWVMDWSYKLLMLDMHTMEFSAVDIPKIYPPCSRVIVEAGEGKFGMFTLSFDMEYRRHELLYTILQNHGNGTALWQSEACISLPLNYHYNITGIAGGYLLLQGIPEAGYSFLAPEWSNNDYFSLNLKTFQVELFCEIQEMIHCATLYVGFPPSLSTPTI